MSAVRCLECGEGFLLPRRALVRDPEWECASCGMVVTNDIVDEVIGTIERQVRNSAHKNSLTQFFLLLFVFF